MPVPRSRAGADRRQFLRTAAGAALATGLGLPAGRAPAASGKRLKVAAVFTEFTYRSHAHVLLENFLEPYYFNGQETDPGCDVVAFYGDQFPAGRDLAHAVGKAFGIPIYPTIAGALCAGGKELAVDAVLSIGEHGNYPVNKKGQREYPRRRFFDDIVAVFRQSGRVVPVFNDKHLSYSWELARGMYDTARQMKIPLMAGSSVPLAQRLPACTVPAGAKITEAIAIHSGGLDSYDFHALEVLQSMVEGRAGGETGVARVQYVSGDALWRAADAGQWSPDLLQAAWDVQPEGELRRPSLDHLFRSPPWGLLVQYRDGLKAIVLKVGQNSTRWDFACKVAGQSRPLATTFNTGPWQNRNLFKALAHAIQTHFRTGTPPYPVERTLLTTGLVAAGVESHFSGDKSYATPHLNIAYAAPDLGPVREMGASWHIVTDKTAEPRGIDRLGKVAFPFSS